MQKDEQSMLCSIGLLQTETSLALILPQSRSQERRFRRSNSGQRSRSKENHRSHENPSFFVRNYFTKETTFTPPLKDSTPQKSSRRNNHIRGKDDKCHKENDPQGMAKLCEGLNELLQKSNSYILQLQGRIGELQQELKAKTGSAGEKTKPRENRGNLARLRKQIAQTRNSETVPSEALAQQVRQLQAENLCLKQEVQSLKEKNHKKEQQSQNARSQREAQLQTIILQLRQSLKMSQKREGQLQMQVDRLRLRQRKQCENMQQAKNEELSYLRFRYQTIRKKLQENKRQLQVFQRRAASRAYLFHDGQSVEVSLSLSP